MERDVKKFLTDISSAINEIEIFFENRPLRFDVYVRDICLKRAVERNITIIGEAMNRVLKLNPSVNITSARNIVDTRNYVIHGYDSVTDEIIWAIVVRHLPILKAEVAQLLDNV
ncbi:MAG: DUF86 domain-containing protein [Bacteroidales bacterium]|nr:DUF86 domain-containing protein [Bacteroidales bacterium]